MKACNRKILELFYNAKHTGRISKPDAIGRVGEDDEGLVIELTWRVIGGIIAEAKFRAFANPNAIAITSLMVDNMIGKSVEDALSLGEEVIIDNLGEFLPEYLEVYDMVRECIAEAYNNYLKRQTRSEESVQFDYEQYRATHNIEEGQEIDVKQIQRELYGEVKVERRGRPRKEVDPNAVVEVGEKRGRGRPRKEINLNEVIELGVKRGRGRPRKEVNPDEIVEIGEKRGRGRPRKEVDPNAVVEVGEKRGRGRPRKEVNPDEMVEIGEKRGRGRPKKEVRFNLPSDLDDVIEDEELDSLINGNSSKSNIVEDTNLVEVEENAQIYTNDVTENVLEQNSADMFEADYDLFKSNIRNILSGKELSSKSYTHNSTISTNSEIENGQVTDNVTDTNVEVEADTEIKRGRGRPRKEVDISQVEDDGEKRGRGRPRKIVIEEVEDDREKRGRGRPRLQPINSLTRSLTPNSLLSHSNQDIVFASKNVTTTNININVTKTSTSIDDNTATTNDYSHNTTISQQKVEVSLPKLENKDEEIDIEPNKLNTVNNFKDFDDDDDEIDVSDIKDEAPTGGIQDLLKALLDD